MNVQWAAVLFGWLVDFILSFLLQMIIIGVGMDAFYNNPSLTNPIHLGIMLLFVLVVGVGGFIAARRAGTAFAFHGFLVGITDILITSLLNIGYAVPRPFILVQILGCIAAALGGLLAMRLQRA